MHTIAVREQRAFGPDGSTLWGAIVEGILPTFYDVGWIDVYARFQGAATGDWMHVGRGRQFPLTVRHDIFRFRDEAIEVTAALVSVLGATLGPDGSPSVVVTLANGSDLSPDVLPPDVSGFVVDPVMGGVLFTWTPITDRPDVLGYEIRAGATGWLSATVVTACAPVNCPCIWVPRSRATGTSFYIKAKTRSEIYSNAVATATLTAAEGACLDAESAVGYQEVTIAAGGTSVSVTTVCPYTNAPYLVAGSSSARGLTFGWGTWAQNGDNTWTATLYASAVAPTGGWLVILHEAGS